MVGDDWLAAEARRVADVAVRTFGRRDSRSAVAVGVERTDRAG